MKNRIQSLIILILISFVVSCEKDPTSCKDGIVPEPALKGAFIVNEGSFTAANASLSYFNSDSGKIFNNVFKSANGENLGSVANSILIHDTLVYIVVNNSDKIEVIGVNSFKKIVTIQLPAGSSPRHLALLNDTKGYVSNLYMNSCSIIDLAVNNGTLSPVDVPKFIEDLSGFGFTHGNFMTRWIHQAGWQR